MGKFISQSIEVKATIISINTISQDLSKGKIKHNRVFKQKSLDDLLKTLANDLSLNLQVYNNLKNKQIAYYLQENKTSLEVPEELSEIFYATANIKDNKLVFVSKDSPKPKLLQSGKLGANENIKVASAKKVKIAEEDILNITKQDIFSRYYNGVICNSWNINEANHS